MEAHEGAKSAILDCLLESVAKTDGATLLITSGRQTV